MMKMKSMISRFCWMMMMMKKDVRAQLMSLDDDIDDENEDYPPMGMIMIKKGLQTSKDLAGSD